MPHSWMIHTHTHTELVLKTIIRFYNEDCWERKKAQRRFDNLLWRRTKGRAKIFHRSIIEVCTFQRFLSFKNYSTCCVSANKRVFDKNQQKFCKIQFFGQNWVNTKERDRYAHLRVSYGDETNAEGKNHVIHSRNHRKLKIILRPCCWIKFSSILGRSCQSFKTNSRRDLWQRRIYQKNWKSWR